jgi:hypothetical protein
VSIDSLGFEEYYRRLYLEVGVTMSGVTKDYFQKHDRKRKFDKEYSMLPARRTKRAKLKLDKIQTAWKLDVEDKKRGHTYRTAMGAPKVVVEQSGRGKRKAQEPNLFCNHCGNRDHQRRTSKKCPKNVSVTVVSKPAATPQQGGAEVVGEGSKEVTTVLEATEDFDGGLTKVGDAVECYGDNRRTMNNKLGPENTHTQIHEGKNVSWLCILILRA